MQNPGSKFFNVFLFVFLFSLSAYATEGSVVTVESPSPGTFTLKVNGSPWYIKGAGWNRHMEDIGPAGGNTIRTWGADNLGSVLDEAQKNGLMVIAGLWIPHERHGFNYSDRKSRLAELERFRQVVRTYKNHPALLLWGVGNEYNLQWRNPGVWTFVNDVSQMIHSEDGNHPVMSVLAGIITKEISLLKEMAPDVDILGINGYAGLDYFIKELKKTEWTKPWIVSEWGPAGYWEVETTSWGTPLEPPSGIKADQFRAHYRSFSDEPACLGACIFFWGWKQERTHTWFGLYLPDGRPLETRSAISELWTGKKDTNAPVRVEGIRAEGFDSREIIVAKGKKVAFQVSSYDAEEDELTYSWDIFAETTATSSGGDHEKRTEYIPDMIVGTNTQKTVSVHMNRKGKYRLFVYVSDGKGIWATANIPFMIR